MDVSSKARLFQGFDGSGEDKEHMSHMSHIFARLKKQKKIITNAELLVGLLDHVSHSNKQIEQSCTEFSADSLNEHRAALEKLSDKLSQHEGAIAFLMTLCKPSLGVETSLTHPPSLLPPQLPTNNAQADLTDTRTQRSIWACSSFSSKDKQGLPRSTTTKFITPGSATLNKESFATVIQQDDAPVQVETQGEAIQSEEPSPAGLADPSPAPHAACHKKADSTSKLPWSNNKSRATSIAPHSGSGDHMDIQYTGSLIHRAQTEIRPTSSLKLKSREAVQKSRKNTSKSFNAQETGPRDNEHKMAITSSEPISDVTDSSDDSMEEIPARMPIQPGGGKSDDPRREDEEQPPQPLRSRSGTPAYKKPKLNSNLPDESTRPSPCLRQSSRRQSGARPNYSMKEYFDDRVN